MIAASSRHALGLPDLEARLQPARRAGADQLALDNSFGFENHFRGKAKMKARWGWRCAS